MIKGLNKKATIKNARNLLECYRYFEKMLVVGMNDDGLKNLQKNMEGITGALRRLPDTTQHGILYRKYIEGGNSDWELMEHFGVDQREYYRKVNRGLLEFACIYDFGSLLAFDGPNVVSRVTGMSPLQK